MRVTKLHESGYDEAVLGFSLSYNTSLERTKQILPKYAFGIPGENKFLECIEIWLDVTAPRYWWQEADTYRVGSTKQSESTMHTLCKKPLTQENFEGGEDIFPETIEKLNDLIDQYKSAKEPALRKQLKRKIKKNLPEGFLQRRVWAINYKTLGNIYTQRAKHELIEWQVFLSSVLNQIEHQEFIIKETQNAID